MKSGLALALTIMLLGGNAGAQALDARFSCSMTDNADGEHTILADSAEARFEGSRLLAFRWESALFRSSHGFDCSIDESDSLVLETSGDANNAWRVTLADAHAARRNRGYDFDRELHCSIDLVREGNRLSIAPDCPALCGSRGNFTALSVDLDTGTCRYGK